MSTVCVQLLKYNLTILVHVLVSSTHTHSLLGRYDAHLGPYSKILGSPLQTVGSQKLILGCVK